MDNKITGTRILPIRNSEVSSGLEHSSNKKNSKGSDECALTIVYMLLIHRSNKLLIKIAPRLIIIQDMLGMYSVEQKRQQAFCTGYLRIVKDVSYQR